MIDWDKMAKWLPWNNPTPASLVILVVIIAFFSIRSCEAADTLLDVGATILSGEYSEAQYMIIEERFSDSRYSVGFGIFGNQVYKTDFGNIPVNTNLTFFVMRNVRWKRLTMGLGPGYWSNTNRALGKHFTVRITIAVNVWKRLDVRLGHGSNAGSGEPNGGQDSIGVTWAFD